MSPSKRMAVNALATYGRSLLSMALALFSSRWVLQSLGVSDFGLYSVVGSLIIFVIFLNNVMASSVSRFFAYSIGKGDLAELKGWFNTAVGIHLGMSLLLVAVGWPIGEYLIRHVLTIPAARVETSAWVFRISLVSAFASMVAVPFVGMFTAKQRISDVALWGMVQSILSFGLAWSLQHAQGDKLWIYAIGMVAIVVFMQSGLVIGAMRKFAECRLSPALWFNGHRSRRILSFASWNLIGSTGAVLRDQGTAILLNIFFGPKINAGYGIATQVSTQTNQLSAAMIGAFSPEITASEGRGDRSRMLRLADQASKFGTLLVMLFAIPMMIEMDYILVLWLKQPPELASGFCRLILATFLVDRLTTGTMLAVNAHGKIAAYQATVGTCLLLTLPISWALLTMEFPAITVGYVFLGTMLFTSLGRAFWGRHLFKVALGAWLKNVVVPCLVVGLGSVIVGGFTHILMPEGLLRLLATCFATVSITAALTWSVALSSNEKVLLGGKLQKYRIVQPIVGSPIKETNNG